jgi:hypothetical protein
VIIVIIVVGAVVYTCVNKYKKRSDTAVEATAVVYDRGSVTSDAARNLI